MSFPFGFLEALPLFLGRHVRAQDPQDVIVTLRVGEYDHTSLDRPDGDESILLVGMFLVVDFQSVASLRDNSCFVRLILSFAGSHSNRIAHGE
jgi:hypothetical protein